MTDRDVTFLCNGACDTTADISETDPERRNFLRVACASVVAFATLPASVVLAQPKGVKLPLSVDALKPVRTVGGSVVADIPSHHLKVLLVRDSKTSIRAFQSTCTHKKNRLVYNAKTQQIACTEKGPNHDSNFDLSGVALTGAAKRMQAEGKPGNLHTYPTKLVTEGGSEFLLIKLG